MTITPPIFDTYLPAFRTPGGEIFNKMQGFLSSEGAKADIVNAEKYATTGELPAAIERLVCLRAAWKALPTLDLVATSTGFGIVSNQNTAPASKERVAALRESLREQKCEAAERVLLLLFNTDWRESAECDARLYCNLVFAPFLLRRYGVTLEGQPIFEEEYERLATERHYAADALEALISPELHERLARLQYSADPEAETHAVTLVTERARRFLASHIMRRDPRTLQRIGRSLLEAIRDNAEEFPEYTGSTEYAAQTATRYENKQEHTTFFFS